MGEISLKDAIQIAQILSKAPEERLPLILSVLERADFTVDGLEEVAEWRAFKEQASLIDLEEFTSKLFDRFPDKDGKSKIKVEEFNKFCKELKTKPILVKRLLADRGLIETNEEGKKVNFTETVWIDGKAVRCVVVLRKLK